MHEIMALEWQRRARISNAACQGAAQQWPGADMFTNKDRNEEVAM